MLIDHLNPRSLQLLFGTSGTTSWVGCLLAICIIGAASFGRAQSPSKVNTSRPKKVPSGIDAGSVVAEEQSRLRNSQPKGDPVSISLFGGKPVSGRSFVFLIDRSKSMNLGALATAEKQLVAAVNKLQPHHEFQIVAYSSQCTYLRQRKLLPATDENKQAISGFLNKLTATGTTEHEMALQSGLQHQPDVLFLLTDGGDPALTDKQILRLTKTAGDRTAIHCIQFGWGQIQEPKNFLVYLANQNRGTFTFHDLKRTE
jgi:hypothetical protein